MKPISSEVPGTSYNYNGIEVCEAVYALIRMKRKLPEKTDHMGSTCRKAETGEN